MRMRRWRIALIMAVFLEGVALGLSGFHNVKVELVGEVWKIIPTGEDPYFSLDIKDFEAHREDVIKFLVMTEKASSAQFYWITDKNPRWGEANHVDFTIPATVVPGTGELTWQEYAVPIGALNPHWSGRVIELRLDPDIGARDTPIFIKGFRIERGKEMEEPYEISQPGRGEVVEPVRYGVRKSLPVRYIENDLYKVEFAEGAFTIYRRRENALEKIAEVSFVALGDGGEIIFDSKNYPKDKLYCTFAEKYLAAGMGVNYEAGENLGRFWVWMRLHELPYFEYVARKGNIGGWELRVEFDRPITFEGDLREIKAGGENGLIIRAREREEILFFDRTPQDIKMEGNLLRVRMKKEGRVWLGAGEDERQKFVDIVDKEFVLVKPEEVRLDKPILPIDGVIEARFHDATPYKRTRVLYIPGWVRVRRPQAVQQVSDFVSVTGEVGGVNPVFEDKLLFGSWTSSNVVLYRVPVRVRRLLLPDLGDEIYRAWNVCTDKELQYKRADGWLVFEDVGAGLIGIKYRKLKDFRVLFTMYRPVKAPLDFDLVSNYLYPQLMYLWDAMLDEEGRLRLERIDYIDRMWEARKQPIFLGLHYGNHAPPDQYDILHGKYGEKILQMDNFGKVHPGLKGGFGTPPWMCLVHPLLRREIKEKLDQIFQYIKGKEWWEDIIGYSSTSEPWIVDDPDDPNRLYCYNPEHIKWFREYEKKKWGSIEKFNRIMGTDFKSFDGIEPPRKREKSALFNEWWLSRYEAVIDAERFYRTLIYKYDPTRPNFSHLAIMLLYDRQDVANSIDLLFAGREIAPDKFLPGGSLYTNNPYEEAFIVDSFRGVTTSWAAFPEAFAGNYSQMYDYLVGASSLFEKTLHMAIPTTSWGGEPQVGDAWCVFYEIMPFLALDMGGVPRPEVAIVYSPLSRNKDVLQNIHSQLIRHHFDRCIISDRMVEEGCLKEADFKLIILPYVKVLSREALEEILDAQERGAKIWIVGEFALHDEYFRADEGYKRLRENVVKGAIVGGSLEMAVAKAGLEPIIAGELEDVIAYRKEHGVILLNRGMGRVVRVALPEWMRGEYVAVVSDVGQVREIRRAGKEMEVYLPTLQAVAIVEVKY